MSHAEPKPNSETGGTRARFEPTHWTLVLQAADPSTPEAQAALNELCRIYWFPLYAYIRVKESDRHRAKDLTQAFFVHLLGHEILRKVDPANGRFRSFLLACLQNFLTSEWRKETTEKRGGRTMLFSLDEEEAEQRYSQLPANEPDPTVKFDRAWAVTVIEQVAASLKQDYAGRGKLRLYESLSPCLSSELPADFYSVMPAKLGMTLDALRVNVFRFREAFARCLREEISRIVATPEDIDAEIRHLMFAWAGHLLDSKGAVGKAASATSDAA